MWSRYRGSQETLVWETEIFSVARYLTKRIKQNEWCNNSAISMTIWAHVDSFYAGGFQSAVDFVDLSRVYGGIYEKLQATIS